MKTIPTAKKQKVLHTNSGYAGPTESRLGKLGSSINNIIIIINPVLPLP